MNGKPRTLELRAAKSSDFEFAWIAWAEAVKPYVAPVIASKFGRSWDPEDEQRRFSTWWSPELSSVITLDGESIGWLASEKAGEIMTLANFVVIEKYRHLGVASIIIGAKLNEWAAATKTVAHSVLKSSGHASFFERFGFKPVGEDDLVVFMEASIA